MRSFKQRVFLFLLAGVGSLCLAGPNPHVVLETNFGDITIELYPDDAPITVDNFLSYVNSGFYDGLIFHRAENRDQFGFGLDVIQGGGYSLGGNTIISHPTGDPIINESYNALSNARETISMARTSEPDSATSQFFINHQDNVELDRDFPDGDGYGYCVFGVVVVGMDTVDSIAQTNVVVVPNFTNFFPYNPPVFIHTAYELPCELSYCSDLVSPGRINFPDFAIFASHWLEDCNSENGFCDGADLDYSGGVDILDLDLFWSHWAQTAGHERQFSDLSLDNTINPSDFLVFFGWWLDPDCNQDNNYCDRADINRDGIVDLVDYSLLSSHWLGSY
ncbi:MAG: peptidylprolyl isomerase [Planctomycetota bacterium]|jgi:cyclophilin family peptidyl-prolyl cis-trans isomerase